MQHIPRKVRTKHLRQKRSDEKYLYFALERDLDRHALFPEHDGWYSEISFSDKKNRIDFVIKYGKKLFGIEVKIGAPRKEHFEQALRYLPALNGVFLAYPSERVGEALYECEKCLDFNDVGVISLTMYRSHIIKKAPFFERKNEEIWEEYLLDDKAYEEDIKKSKWEKEDGLAATVLEDGCFWVSIDSNKKCKDELIRLSLNKTDWKGIALLYAATYSTSLDRFFSIKQLEKIAKSLGWSHFDLGKFICCDLVERRSYGNILYLFQFNERAVFLKKELEHSLKNKLGKNEWDKLSKKIIDLRKEHLKVQKIKEQEFFRTI